MSVCCLSYGSKNSFHHSSVTGLFLILCQYQKCTQHWHEIIHWLLGTTLQRQQPDLMTGLIVFQPWFDWCTRISLCSLLVSHQWWHMLWHLKKKILSSSSCTVTGFFKVYFSVACLLAVLVASFWIHRVWIMLTSPALTWEYRIHELCVFFPSLTAAQSPLGSAVSEAQEWHWDGFGSFGLEGGGGCSMKISVAQ